MKRLVVLVLPVMLPMVALAQAPADVTLTTASVAPSKEPLVEFEMMTWVEVKNAIAAGRTTALFYVGGTESRGPQNINGGHTLMARATNKAIALALGNAIAMPVLAYSPNNASAEIPGTIGLTNDLLSAMLERMAEQAIASGFTNVVLMGDHGGGQPAAYKSVADKLEAKYAPQGKHVFFCDQVYATAQNAFENYLVSIGLNKSSHAGIQDTSEMWYLGGEVWTRSELIPTAVGAAVWNAEHPGSPPMASNGISGDARKSSKELGQKAFQNKVDYAVRQIRTFIPPKK